MSTVYYINYCQIFHLISAHFFASFVSILFHGFVHLGGWKCLNIVKRTAEMCEKNDDRKQFTSLANKRLMWNARLLLS